MRYYPSGLQKVIQGIKAASIKAVLLYGPDKGLINNCFSQIEKSFSIPVQKINYVNNVETYLQSSLNNVNLFCNRQIIKCEYISTSVTKIKDILQENFLHILILIADELESNSSLRKFFETTPDLAIIACYYEDDIKKVITDYIFNQNKKITTSALDYLSQTIKGDRYFIINEIEKLVCYCMSDPIIDIEQAIYATNHGTLIFSDKLCSAFANQDIKIYLAELDKLQSNDAILIIRSLIRYYVNLYAVYIKTTTHGIDLSTAIKSITPPIFFREIPAFSSVAKEITLQQISKTLHLLYNAEIEYKSHSNLQQEILSRLLYTI